MTYNLPSGAKVITYSIGAEVEFETRNAAGDTISTVRLPDDSARLMLADLARNAV